MAERRGPDERFDDIESMLRNRRHRPTPLDLDRVKLQAKRQAERPPAIARGGLVKPGRRIVTVAVALGLVASGGGAAAAMSGKIHVFTHPHKTASAAWFQYKPPCSPGHKGKWVKVKPGTRASWKHDPCKPPPCKPMSKNSKAHAAGHHRGCPPPKPPPCGKQAKAHAAGVSHGCNPNPCGKQSSAHAAGVSNGCPPTSCSSSVRGVAAGANPCQPTPCSSAVRGVAAGANPCDFPNTPTTDQQVAAPLPTPLLGTGPTTQTHTVKKVKHKAKRHARHKAKRHAKHKAKKHAKHKAKKHSKKR